MSEKVYQLEIEETSQRKHYYSVIEAILFVSGEPLDLKEISQIIECDKKYTEILLEELKDVYEDSARGIKLIKLNNKYQLVTKPEFSNYIEKLLKTNVRQALSQASLETLAIIAYNQPVTRVNIDEIRGVKSDSAIFNLLERKLIQECGRLDVPGRPILYSTTYEFLRHFKLEDLKQLPNLSELFQDDNNNSEDKE